MFYKIKGELINDVDVEQVQELIESILTNGWQGAPILYHSSIGLITGSHRKAALDRISEMYYNDELSAEQETIVEQIDEDGEYALDVTDIVDAWMDENPGEEWEYDSIGKIFEGTAVEMWKDEIIEW